MKKLTRSQRQLINMITSNPLYQWTGTRRNGFDWENSAFCRVNPKMIQHLYEMGHLQREVVRREGFDVRYKYTVKEN